MFTKEQIDEIESALKGRKQIRRMQKRAKRAEKRAQKAQRRALQFRPNVNTDAGNEEE